MELDQLVRISKYAGERFDLVQAAGGNSSAKLEDGSMLIKASGYLLSDVEKDSGYARVNIQHVKSAISNEMLLKSTNKRERETIASSIVNASAVAGPRPSIETLLHSFLLKYTLHTHPLAVNMIANRPDWREVFESIFPGEHIGLVNYQTPGVELAIELTSELRKFARIPKLIFLQNHGLIVTSDSGEEVDQLTDRVVASIEKFLGINLDRYKNVNHLSQLMRSVGSDSTIAYLSEDARINEALSTNKKAFFALPFCPDKQVFCGARCLEIKSPNDVESVKAYQTAYFELPKVLLYRGYVYIVAKTLKKAKETEEVLKFHVMSLSSANAESVNYLPMDELAYLARWEAEEYRKKI